jgi:trimeric autotransporter adhesin
MNAPRTRIIFIFCSLFVKSTILAQLTGTYSVPGSFTSIAAAISSLNTLGVGGAVTINIAAGYSETVSAGGFSIFPVAGATATSGVVFQRSGAGANPLVVGFTGSATPASAKQDGIWSLIGADYVTIDGIDLLDPNTSNPATMEYGYGLFKASATDGCQYNVIQNCTVTLNRINGVAGSGISHAGSKAIWIQNALPTSQTVAVSVTSVQGTNSYNSFYGNVLQNCNSGFVLMGNVPPFASTIVDNGNDIGGVSAANGNTIINYGGGGTLIAAAVQASLQSACNISYNIVNNNTGAGFIHQGVLWGINSITERNASVQLNHNMVSLSSGTLNNITYGIANAAWTANTATFAVAMNNNTVTNCTIQNGLFYALVSGSQPTQLQMNGNLVSNLTVASANGLIRTSSGATGNILSNTITGVVSTQTVGEINGILVASSFTTNVSYNLVENITFSANAGATSITGIESDSKDINCSGNIVRGLSVPATGTITGINQKLTWPNVAGVISIDNNQVYNFSRYSNGAGGATFMGILCVGGTVQLQGNSIYSLQSSYSTGTTVPEVHGIKIASVQVVQIIQNKVHNLRCDSPKGVVYGISTAASTLCTLANNLIGALSAPSATGSIKLAGMLLNGNTHNVYYNSVYLNAVTTSTLAGSAAVYAVGSNTLDLRNNILVNKSQAAGNGVTAALRSDANFMQVYSPLSNNNLFYAGTPSTTQVIYYDGSVTYSTLASYKAITGLSDLFSVSEDPPFISTVGTATNYLALITTTPTQAESGAYPVTGITVDFSGSTRNAQTPDIGAWEGNYTNIDLLAPGIFSYGFTSPLTHCNTTGRTFTVNFGDLSGVASGSLAPRAYYKIGSSSYSSVDGTLTAGTPTNGIWTFNMLFNASPTATISWYIVAQDVATVPNLSSYPSAGFSATDVNNIVTHPVVPFTYSVTYTLNGSYTVGASGTFTSLTRAAHVYNTGCLTGTVQYVLTNTLYALGENFPITFTNHLQASPTTSLVIIPMAATHPTVMGPSSITAVFKFEAARHIVIDGINSQGSALTIINTSSVGPPNASSTIWLAEHCEYIGIKRSNIYGATSNSLHSRCITSSSADVVVPVAGGGNDYITIEGNSFYRCFDAIHARGINVAKVRHWQILNNVFGTVNTGTNEITNTAIVTHWAEDFLISGNHVRRITALPYRNAAGIFMLESYTMTVSQNTIQNVNADGYQYPNAPFSSQFSGAGIYAGFDTEAISILSNSITGVSSTSTDYPPRGPSGILCYGMDGNVALSRVQNNMVSNIHGFSGTDDKAWVVGIRLSGAQNMLVDHNSVNLSGTHTGTTLAWGSAAMMVDAYADTLWIRNNILSNTYYNLTSNTGTSYAFFAGVNVTSFTMDYTSYHASCIINTVVVSLAGYGNTSLTTLSAIQSTIGGNLNSVVLYPPFTSSVDLHILQNTPAGLPLHNTALPVGVMTDIDQQVRSSTVPDIGADEFTLPVCTSAEGGTITPASVTLCPGSTLVATSFSATTGYNSGFQWQVSQTPGGPYTNVTTGAGYTSTSYTLPVTTPGTLYYVMRSTCGSTVPATSNELTVTVHPYPVISVNSGSVCLGNTITLSASGAASYTFNNGSLVHTLPSLTYTATASTAFSVSGTSSLGCVSQSFATAQVTVIPLPVVTVPGQSICAGLSGTFNPTGAVTYTYLPSGPVVTPVSTTVYTITGTSAQGCVSAPASATIFVMPLPTVSVNSGSICSGQTFTIIPSGGVTYSISGNNVQVSPLVTTQYTVKAYNQISCESVNTATATVTVQALPVVSVTGGSICAGNQFTLQPTGATVYSFSGPNIISAGSVQAVVLPQSTTVYSVQGITNSCNSANSPTVLITVVSVPAVAVNSGSICAGQSFTILPSGAANYSVSGNATVVSPPTSTNYVVVGYNNAGCSSSVIASVSVFPNPTLFATATPTAICAGSPATLQAGGAHSYTWSNGNQGANMVVFPSTNTVYAVAGSFTTGCLSNTQVLNITVHSLPTIAVFGATTVCAGQPATLQAISQYPVSWSSGGTGSTNVVTPFSTTIYTAGTTNNLGCSSSGAVTVTVNPLPNISVTGPSAVCSGVTQTLSASGGNSYLWMPGGYSGVVFTVYSISSAQYTVLGTDANGCVGQSTHSLTVIPLPTLQVISPTVVCEGEEVTLIGTGAASYTWDNSGNGPVYMYVAHSPLTHTLTGTLGSSLCARSITFAVNVDPCLGIKDIVASALNLFPNPNSGRFTARANVDLNMSIFNELGQMVWSASLLKNARADISDLAEGVYFVIAVAREERKVFKVIVTE